MKALLGSSVPRLSLTQRYDPLTYRSACEDAIEMLRHQREAVRAAMSGGQQSMSLDDPSIETSTCGWYGS